MKQLWPELLVLVLFLLGDILWDGLASAAAGVAAGLSSFILLLAFRKKKPGLIIEGLIFGGVTALGELVDYPGGTLILMELVFAVILLVSVLSRRNILAGMAGGLGKGLFSDQQSRILTRTIGYVFLIHSLICTILAVLGFLNKQFGGILFLIVYLLALKLSKPGMKNAVLDSLPVLVEEEESIYRLEIHGTVIGKLTLTEDTSTSVTARVISIELPPHDFLSKLEIAMKRRGIRGLTIDCWNWDEIELEMDGLVKIEGKWRKRLR